MSKGDLGDWGKGGGGEKAGMEPKRAWRKASMGRSFFA
jgi:hypothetical protein